MVQFDLAWQVQCRRLFLEATETDFLIDYCKADRLQTRELVKGPLLSSQV